MTVDKITYKVLLASFISEDQHNFYLFTFPMLIDDKMIFDFEKKINKYMNTYWFTLRTIKPWRLSLFVPNEKILWP